MVSPNDFYLALCWDCLARVLQLSSNSVQQRVSTKREREIGREKENDRKFGKGERTESRA